MGGRTRLKRSKLSGRYANGADTLDLVGNLNNAAKNGLISKRELRTLLGKIEQACAGSTNAACAAPDPNVGIGGQGAGPTETFSGRDYVRSKGLVTIRGDNSIEIRAKVFLSNTDPSVVESITKGWTAKNVTTTLEIVGSAAEADFEIRTVDSEGMRAALGWCSCQNAAGANGWMNLKANVMYLNGGSILPRPDTPMHEFSHFIFGAGHGLEGSGRIISYDPGRRLNRADVANLIGAYGAK
jgi:hypothetical protein